MRAVARIVEEAIEDGPGQFERFRGLEQRDHVESGRRARGGALGQAEDAQDVVGLHREADDVALDGSRPESILRLRHHPEGREDFVERHAGRDVTTRRIPGVEGRLGCPMDGGVLADLHRREVEPERLELPAQVLDLAPRHAGQPVPDECVGKLAKLDGQRIRGRVRAVGRSSAAGQARPRAAQALGDEPESLAIRLLRESTGQLSSQIGQVRAVDP